MSARQAVVDRLRAKMYGIETSEAGKVMRSELEKDSLAEQTKAFNPKLVKKAMSMKAKADAAAAQKKRVEKPKIDSEHQALLKCERILKTKIIETVDISKIINPSVSTRAPVCDVEKILSGTKFPDVFCSPTITP